MSDSVEAFRRVQDAIGDEVREIIGGMPKLDINALRQLRLSQGHKIEWHVKAELVEGSK